MASANLVSANDSSFDTEVLSSEVPVLVDFWATWCGPCKAIAPHLEALAGDSDGKFKVVKVDVDSARAVAMKYRVTSIPTLMVFKGGQVVGQHVGVAALPALRKLVESHV